MGSTTHDSARYPLTVADVQRSAAARARKKRDDDYTASFCESPFSATSERSNGSCSSNETAKFMGASSCPSPSAAAEWPDDGHILDCMDAFFHSPNAEDRASALQDLRQMSKSRDSSRAMVKVGLISLLIPLLISGDSKTVECAASTLFNLVLEYEHKVKAVGDGVLYPLLVVSTRQDNQSIANTGISILCSLTAERTIRKKLREAGVVQVLAQGLITGNSLVRRDTAKGLFNLAEDAESKKEVVQAGVIRSVVDCLDTVGCSVEFEFVTLLATLAKVECGCTAIEAAGGLSVLVSIAEDGSLKSKESAVSAILSMVEIRGKPILDMLWSEGALPPLIDVANQGSKRARMKARTLMELLRNHKGSMNSFRK